MMHRWNTNTYRSCLHTTALKLRWDPSSKRPRHSWVRERWHAMLNIVLDYLSMSHTYIQHPRTRLALQLMALHRGDPGDPEAPHDQAAVEQSYGSRQNDSNDVLLAVIDIITNCSYYSYCIFFRHPRAPAPTHPAIPSPTSTPRPTPTPTPAAAPATPQTAAILETASSDRAGPTAKIAMPPCSRQDGKRSTKNVSHFLAPGSETAESRSAVRESNTNIEGRA